SSEAFGTFGFDIHHRYSDTVKQFLNIDGLPEEGTVDYYTAMAHRDHLFKGRRLAAATTPHFLCLHYSYIRVGTPAAFFLVALDTGTDLFWLPCDCPNCPRYYNRSDGSRFDLEIYSPSNSTTSKPLPCSSPICGPKRRCSVKDNACAYEILHNNASSSGILVDDVLHLGTDTNPQDPVDVAVTLGCGKNQTGDYLNRGGRNGVFGLGMDSISVPSILASKNITANSFSVCFVTDGRGRIEFGDKGSADQKTTPFNLENL
ncbi:PREDICTED: aspartic proteinase-like protein 1, partial [Erythranthe guttata]|uniref:aspartic proteinase-like protein 1 n=1 Tax=Erythranthe guttata TaxID=4155 RepID=UPI00064DB9D0